MKVNTYLISACLGIFLLLSCNNDDDDIPVSQKDYPWYWGYFEGEINGEKIFLKSPGISDSKVGFSAYDSYTSTDSQDSIKGLCTAIHYAEGDNLHIELYNPYVGVRYITGYTTYFKETMIYITKPGKPNTTGYDLDSYYNYYPDSRKPFRMEILSSFYEYSFPVVKVKLDGVLYCRDNPEDSIVVKGTYGNKVYDGTDNF